MSLTTDALLFSIVLLILGLQGEVAKFVDAYFFISPAILVAIVAFLASLTATVNTQLDQRQPTRSRVSPIG